MRRKAALLAMAMVAEAQDGKFYDRWTATKQNVTIEIVVVHTSPGCDAFHNCPWMVKWISKKRTDTVEVGVTRAGGPPVPEIAPVVPGKRQAPLDQQWPVFTIPLAEVAAIDLTFRNGTKEVLSVSF